MILLNILYILISYVIGSIPFGLVLTKAAGLGDIRKIGSGNIGATNVLRTGRKDLALLTLILDAGKAAFAALLFQWLSGSQIIGVMAGVAAIIGHNYPVFLKFKGGKGVAATLGLMLAATPLVGVLTALTWLFMAFTFRYSSLSALTALALAPLYALVFTQPIIALIYLLLTILSFYRHKDNIQRILNKEESKISFKGKANK